MTPTAERIAQSRAVLHDITAAAGLSSVDATPIRLAENDIWLLPHIAVVRIARKGQEMAAVREVAVARWLKQQNVAAVRSLPVQQPVYAAGRAATFWEELPPHRPGTEAELAPLLRDLHQLPIPDLELGTLDPFVRISERLEASATPSADDRAYLLDRLDDLRARWDQLPAGLPRCVIHGDAWGGNCAVTREGAVLLDFERTSLGPPEWDLTSTAIAVDTFGSLSQAAYADFATAYGHDVRAWEGYPVLREIRELRLTTFALQIADQDQSAAIQARHRIECLRGRYGARPWNWQPVG
ncbi:phosphotransferase family protein [Streptomyces sp. 5.8]|uniref:phosphotransferase family protein n=1 Tax=Streptomyces sp. 5.8 TaxID=3406571 RepID=UPI003BB552B8